MEISRSHQSIPDIIYASQSIKSFLITMWSVLNDEFKPLEMIRLVTGGKNVEETCLVTSAERNNVHSFSCGETGPQTLFPIPSD